MILIELERLYGTDDADGEAGEGEAHRRVVWINPNHVACVTADHAGRTMIRCGWGSAFLVKETVAEAIAKLNVN